MRSIYKVKKRGHMIEFIAHPLVFNSLVLIASLYLLFKSADLLVLGISRYAKRLGLSDALIGLVVVAMAASAPEIISALMGFLSANENVGFGALLGSNMVHAALAMGLVLVIGKKVELEPNIFTKKRFIMWIALMLPFVLASDGRLSRADGAIMVGSFVAYLFYLWQIEGSFGKIKKDVKIQHIWRDVLIFLGCFAALILAGRWLVFSAMQLSNYFGVPAYFIALTVIGVGATMPDLAVEIKAVFKKHASIGMGDLLGSLTIEMLLFLGLVAMFFPLNTNLAQNFNAFLFLAASITIIMFWMNKKALTRKHGLVLLAVYLVFISIEIMRAF